jgi:hypothetical protein
MDALKELENFLRAGETLTFKESDRQSKLNDVFNVSIDSKNGSNEMMFGLIMNLYGHENDLPLMYKISEQISFIRGRIIAQVMPWHLNEVVYIVEMENEICHIEAKLDDEDFGYSFVYTF